MEPLVAPGPPLTPEQVQRYARHLLLDHLGEAAQRRLLAATVAVVGAGGLGSPALLYLAAAGVGRLRIIDDDVVEVSNLQRQIIHGHADVGVSKLDSATARLAALNPDTAVEQVRDRLTAANAADLLAGVDLVLDGTDTFDTRYAVADACAALDIPLVWGSVLGFDAQVSVFWPSQPDGVTLRDLFPTPPAPGTVPSCAEAGVLGSLTGQIGSVMATEAVKLITGVGDPLHGRVLVLDGLRQRWTEVPLRPRPATAPAPARAQAPLDPPDPYAVTTADLVDADVVYLDVREPDEVAAGAIPGALTIPLAHLLTADGAAHVPAERAVVAYCKAGPRSQRAADRLRSLGIDARWLVGGYPGWAAANPSRKVPS